MLCKKHVPFIEFPPKVTSCKTTVGYYNQDIDIDTFKIQNTSITMRIPHVVLIFLKKILFIYS